MIVLSINPATHGTACTLWVDGALIDAGYAPNKCKSENIVRRCAASAQAAYDWLDAAQHKLAARFGGQGPRTKGGTAIGSVDALVVELPQVYPRGANKTKGDPNKTCLPLAMVDAALAALFPAAEVHSYQPHSWKGTTQKPEKAYDAQGHEVSYIIKDRVKARLTPDELAVIDWTKSVSHSWDVADAVGVGLHHMGRFERIEGMKGNHE